MHCFKIDHSRTRKLKLHLIGAAFVVSSAIGLAAESARALTYTGDFGTGTTFRFPRGVAVDRSGNVFVTDVGAERVAQFDSTGNFVSNLTGTRFALPYGVAVDNSGNVFVGDVANNRIARFEAIPVPFGFSPIWTFLPIGIRAVSKRLRKQKQPAIVK